MENTELKQVAQEVADKVLFCSKEVLTTREVARYMDISLSTLYHLTMQRKIPHYKPNGKVCYFNRHEVEQWLQTNRVATDAELNDRANAYCWKGGAR